MRTRAPSATRARACAAPSPRAAPVTMATLPDTRAIFRAPQFPQRADATAGEPDRAGATAAAPDRAGATAAGAVRAGVASDRAATAPATPPAQRPHAPPPN